MKGLARLFGMNSDIDKAEASAPRPDAEAETTAEETGIQMVRIEAIVPNPFQPRKTFTEEALQELSASIREYGVIQPLLLRRSDQGYELVAGERRLRASKLAGLEEVPALVREMDDKETAELAMIENLQREDLHFLEEAEGFALLIANFGFTQEALAGRMSKSQSTIANKLRLLKLSDAVRQAIFAAGLTERHARALLRLPEEESQLEIVRIADEKRLNVRETEELIEKASTAAAPPAKKKRVVGIVRDARIYLNTIDQLTRQMRKSGLKVKVKQEQSDDYITVKMIIPKQKK